MAKSKKNNNIQITSVKSNSDVLKNGTKTTIANKKTGVKKNNSNIKKKSNVVNKTPKKNQKKPIPKKIINSVEPIEKINELENKLDGLTQEEIIAKRKERNRKKYEKGQKKYRELQDKKKIVVEDIVEEPPKEEVHIKIDEPKKEETPIEEEELVKKTKNVEEDTIKEKEHERKEKRKTNRKTSGFTQTLNNIKEISVTKINDVREKVDDDTIPLGKTFDEKNKRSKRLIKEAIVYAIILTIINILCIVFIDYFNFLRLFDVKALNVVITVIISLIFNFFVSFMVDYFVTNIWLTKKLKKKDGEQNGNNRSIEKKHRKDIRNKKRK